MLSSWRDANATGSGNEKGWRWLEKIWGGSGAQTTCGFLSMAVKEEAKETKRIAWLKTNTNRRVCRRKILPMRQVTSDRVVTTSERCDDCKRREKNIAGFVTSGTKTPTDHVTTSNRRPSINTITVTMRMWKKKSGKEIQQARRRAICGLNSFNEI